MLSQFKEIKKQAVELGKNLENQILESNKYNALKEKYQSLSLWSQKLLKYSIIILLLLVVSYIPVSYFVSSSLSWFEFKSKQKLSLELLKTRQTNAKSPSGVSSESQIKRNIEQLAKRYSPEDSLLQESGTKKEKFLSKKKFILKTPHLNIKQAVQLGTQLHTLNFVRLDSVQFKENNQYPKHYDMEYELSAFLGQGSKKRSPPKKRKKRPKRKTPKRTGSPPIIER